MRRASNVPDGCFALGHFHAGYYECDFVSPWTISAQNVEANLFIVLQDWCGSKYLARPVRPEVQEHGYDDKLPTNRNLLSLLAETELKFCQIFGTNAFPWIKTGDLNAKLVQNHLDQAFLDFVVPQIRVVGPKIVVLFGLMVHEAACRAFDLCPEKNLSEAIDNPFHFDGVLYFTVAHTGRWIHKNRGWEQSLNDWRRIKVALLKADFAVDDEPTL